MERLQEYTPDALLLALTILFTMIGVGAGLNAYSIFQEISKEAAGLEEVISPLISSIGLTLGGSLLAAVGAYTLYNRR